MSGDTGPAQERRTIDTTVAHSARVHDYWLGGKDNYPATRTSPFSGSGHERVIPGCRSRDACHRCYVA